MKSLPSQGSQHRLFVPFFVSLLLAVVSGCGGGGGSALDVGGGGGGGGGGATTALNCNGDRVWTTGASDYNQGFETLISEGGARLGVPTTSATPCGVYWEYNAAANCSLAFTAESYFQQFEGRDTTGFELAVSGNNLVATIDGQSASFGASGLTVQQLGSLPDCT